MTLDTSDAAVARVLHREAEELSALATAIAARPPLPRIEAEDVKWLLGMVEQGRRIDAWSKSDPSQTSTTTVATRLFVLADAAYARQEK